MIVAVLLAPLWSMESIVAMLQKNKRLFIQTVIVTKYHESP